MANYLSKETKQQLRSENPYHIEHIKEFDKMARAIAEEQIKELVPTMINNEISSVISSMLKGLEYDIETIVNISFDDGRDIFNSKAARRLVSSAIYNEIIKHLKNTTINI